MKRSAARFHSSAMRRRTVTVLMALLLRRTVRFIWRCWLGIGWLSLVDGDLVMLAQDFRGASDVAYDAARKRLYVANWNQFSLGFGTRPQLPFAIDVIHLGPARE